ncbi:ATP-binding cassette domain-containing protein [Asticcacaulis sp. EMRT-3]|uniref:cell division ATP-binding protein FtsE n=1 Tax=Asticcacaulis sp. EMRT-3 TaxID=3040349 RepID=UPI0024AFA424|nr:ATP-binding cassette domain-containing protein [Asticcacaulis sp. EMRT-3]MDI7776042.1 ATP-binding cassette domain-containing protein [Asticcacaulis sp. EMRT-3]
MSRRPDTTASPPPTARPAAPVLAFEQVSLGYGLGPGQPPLQGEDDPRLILKNLNFQLPAGSFHFLTGPSGAGKTSLLKLIYLAQQPSQGRISLFGEAVRPRDRAQSARLRSQLGIVFQEFRLLDHLTVFDNAALPLFVHGKNPASYHDDVTELLTWVGLKHRLDAMPELLSGGEKQRLAIARAVVTRPTLILADEPTGNIDYAMGLRIMRLFIELNRLGATVLIATHDEGLVRAAGMPVLELKSGRLSRRDLTKTDPAKGEAS